MTTAELLSVLGLLARRPALWLTAVRVAVRMSRPRWWRQWPPLPGPSPEYARFRAETFLGDDGRPGAEEIVAYLDWCRRMTLLAR